MVMFIKKFKRLLLFLTSIPVAMIFNYYVVMHLLDFINYFEAPGYIISLIIQILLWFEILLFFFDKWNKYDKLTMILVYYVVILFCFLARPKQNGVTIQMNPMNLLKQFSNVHDITIVIFNIGLFIPLVTINGFFIRELKYNICLCITIAFSIEILQVLLHRGIFDICDIILYFIGIGLGVITLKFITLDDRQ